MLELARTKLAPAGIPAVLFTNPGLLAPAPPGLDNLLSWYEARHGLAALCRQVGYRETGSLGALLREFLANLGSRQREGIRQKLLAALAAEGEEVPRAPVLSHDDLRELAGLGVEIGSHTATHVHCRALDADERQAEIVAASEELQAICGRPLRAFSVPYGNAADLTPAVHATLRESGHRAIFLVHARSNRFRPAADTWYRVSLHDEPVTHLPLKLGPLPLLRSLRAAVRPGG